MSGYLAPSSIRVRGATRRPFGIPVKPIGVRIDLAFSEIPGVMRPAPAYAPRRQIQQHDAGVAPVVQEKPVVRQRDGAAALEGLLDGCGEIVNARALRVAVRAEQPPERLGQGVA